MVPTRDQLFPGCMMVLDVAISIALIALDRTLIRSFPERMISLSIVERALLLSMIETSASQTLVPKRPHVSAFPRRRKALAGYTSLCADARMYVYKATIVAVYLISVVARRTRSEIFNVESLSAMRAHHRILHLTHSYDIL